MGKIYSTNGEGRNTYRLIVGKSERRGPVGRPRRGIDNIKIGIGTIR
jgi:hypothetical protein